MPSVTIKYTGDYTKTKNWLQKMKSNWLMRHLDKYGKEGAAALASATPRNTGATAASWSYVIESGPGFSRIVWTNNNTLDSPARARDSKWRLRSGTRLYQPCNTTNF